MAIPTDVEGTWFNVTVSLDAGELRRADAAMFAGDGTVTTGARGGVVRHADTSLAVTVNGSDVVTVQPGSVVVPGNAVAGSGPYRLSLTSAITGSLAARNATNPRITLVVFRALDDDVVTTHDAYKGQIGFIDGTAAASPVAPSLPTMAVELGRITVPQTAGGAASVDSTSRTYAAAIGAEIAVPSATNFPASPAKWQTGRALDTGAKYIYNGTAWVPDGPFAEAAGTTSVTVTASSVGTQAITFPVGRFTLSPVVNLTVAGTAVYTATVPSGLSSAGATVGVRHVDNTSATTSVLVHWTAVQMTPTSAAG